MCYDKVLFDELVLRGLVQEFDIGNVPHFQLTRGITSYEEIIVFCSCYCGQTVFFRMLAVECKVRSLLLLQVPESQLLVRCH